MVNVNKKEILLKALDRLDIDKHEDTIDEIICLLIAKGVNVYEK